MWILKWLPDWFFYMILLIGVVGYFATYLLKFIPIPFISMYRVPVQLVSIICIVIGTFMAGSIHDNEAWLEKVQEMEAKVVKAEQESKTANEKIDTKTEQQKVKIVQKQLVVKQYIDREIVKYDNTCVIPKEFVEVHNKAAIK